MGGVSGGFPRLPSVCMLFGISCHGSVDKITALGDIYQGGGWDLF